MLFRTLLASFALILVMMTVGCVTGPTLTPAELEQVIEQAGTMQATEPPADLHPDVKVGAIPPEWLAKTAAQPPKMQEDLAAEASAKPVKTPNEVDSSLAGAASANQVEVAENAGMNQVRAADSSVSVLTLPAPQSDRTGEQKYEINVAPLPSDRKGDEKPEINVAPLPSDRSKTKGSDVSKTQEPENQKNATGLWQATDEMVEPVAYAMSPDQADTNLLLNQEQQSIPPVSEQHRVDTADATMLAIDTESNTEESIAAAVPDADEPGIDVEPEAESLTDRSRSSVPNSFEVGISELQETQLSPLQAGVSYLPAPDAIGNYQIQVGDQVLIKFLFRPDLNETLIVGDDGLISPSIVPSLQAAGKTAFALKQEIASLLEIRRYNSQANKYDDNNSVEYLIASGDQLEVRFSVLNELNDLVTVRPDGKISLARIGEVTAEGKTPLALQEEITKRYGEEVRNPELVVIMREMKATTVQVNGTPVPLPIKGISDFTVSVIKTAPRLVYVMGELNRPSAIPYYPNMTALRAISAAGGTKRSANLKHVMIIRNHNGCEITEIATDLRPCRKCSYGINSHTDGGFSDVHLQPNDVVLIPKTKIAKVQDWLDQYVYNLFPPLRNSSVFSVIYNNGIPGFNGP